MKQNKKEKALRENLKKMCDCETVQVTFSDGVKTECDVICNFVCEGNILCILFTRGERSQGALLKTYAVFYDPNTEELVLDNEMEADELEMIRQMMNQNLVREDEAKTPVCELVLDEIEEVEFII